MKCQILRPGGIVPQRKSEGAAAFDLHCCGAIALPRGHRIWVPTAIALEIPKGFCGIIFGRSGLRVSHGFEVFSGGNRCGFQRRAPCRSVFLC